MATINENFLKLQANYLFADIAHKVAKYKEAHPDAPIIKLGIGDVTQPLAPSVIEAMQKAVSEMASKETFRGYGPEQGYKFLQKAIAENDFKQRNITIATNEIFINDGAKSDTGNIGDILGNDNIVCVTDPIYPVYIDSNVMGGRSGEYSGGLWNKIIYRPCNAANNFTPELPQEHVDLIYLCYPNNPTGTVISKDELAKWVDYALKHNSIILYDAAYEAYIQDDKIPHSIYEIEGAKKCAIEFHSYSKTAGFTGVRCGYTVVPKELKMKTSTGDMVEINHLWNRRQCTKFNGTSYITQRAAEAIYSEQGKKEIKATIDYYMTNAKIMREALTNVGLQVFGGENAPYIWFKTPKGMSSWTFFDKLLTEVNIVSTPGVGFGPSGEGYIRLTAFGERKNCEEAMKRISKWIKNN